MSSVHAFRHKPPGKRTKVVKKAGSTKRGRSRIGFIVTGHREIEEKREEIRNRIEPGTRLHGARGYKNLARELQFLISKDEDRSLTGVARDSGLGMATVKALWSGRTQRPSFQTVEAIYALYGMDLASNRRLAAVKS